jgi:hypothetical protein
MMGRAAAQPGTWAPPVAPTAPSGDAQQVAVPPEIIDPPWLAGRGQVQREATRELTVFHDFRFTDRVQESGIRFRHRVVDDAGKTYKAVHYDHGTGVAVADVDQDGHSDIYFVNQAGSNELWRNLGGGRFESMAQAAGVAVPDRISVGASFADTDNDGDADLYVTTVRAGNLLFENDGRGRFTDISRTSGLDHQGHSSGAVFFDYDRDGLLDVFLSNVGQYTTETVRTGTFDGTEYTFHDGFEDAFSGHLKPERFERSLLFKNEGKNRFVDVSSRVQLDDNGWTGDASPIDVNEDGWLDLYVLNMQGHDEYYENDGGKRFVKKGRRVFGKTPWGAMGIKVFDYNNDGKMDVYVTDMHSDMSETIGPDREKTKSRMRWPETFVRSGGASIYGNAFYENQGGGRFEEVSDRVGAESYWPWGLSVGDLNADGWEDAFLASGMNYPFRYGVNSVLLNDRGTRFVDSEFVLGVEPRRGGRTAQPWFELDCGGAGRQHRDCRGRTDKVLVWGALGSRSSVIVDLDDDGDLDIVTNDFNSEPMVLFSNLAEQKKPLRFVKVKLIGTTSNRSGLGAIVTVRAGGQTYTKVHDGKSGYLSQSLFPLYFGLDEAGTVDAITVRWPSGREQSASVPIAMSSVVEMREP